MSEETSPETLEAKASKLEAILGAAVEAIITIDAAGIIESANPATQKLFGYLDAELIGQNVKMLMPEPYSSEHDGYLHHHLTTSERKIIGIGREVIGLRKDGTEFPIHLSVSTFEVNDARYFAGIIHDMSERKRAEAATTWLGRIIEDSVNEIFAFDVDTQRFVTVNRGARTNLGYSLAELKELTPVDIKPEFTTKEFAALIEPLRSGDKEYLQFQTIHRRKDGTDYNVEIELHLSRAVDPPVFIAIVVDITDRLHAERALQQALKMDAVGQLTGGLAHDFNNLLTVIIGNLELLEMKIDNPTQSELLSEAQEAADMGARLTERLLAFARRSQLAPEIIDINSLVLGLTDLLRRTLGEVIDIRNALAPGVPATLVDPSQVENVIVNLAINARDAMPDGGKLVIETRNVLIDNGLAEEIGVPLGNYVQVSVSDTGSGMPEDVRARVFEPFYTTKEAGRGNGLGLSMIYGFAKQSGGHVTIYSELDIGTTVNLYLPAAEADVEAGSTDDDNRTPDIGLGAGERILVVEDDDGVRRLTTKRLKTLGYDVTEAINGREALSIFAEDPTFDLVFTDLVMPGGLSGYQLCEKLRELDPETRVLVTSGYAEELLHADDLERRRLRIIRKPYRQMELARIIKEVLNGAE